MGQAQGIPDRRTELFHSPQRLGRHVNGVVWNGMLIILDGKLSGPADLQSSIRFMEASTHAGSSEHHVKQSGA